METVNSDGSMVVFTKHRELKDQLHLDGRKKCFFGVNDLKLLATTRLVGPAGGIDAFPTHWTHGTDDSYFYDPGNSGSSSLRAQSNLNHVHLDTGQLQFTYT